MHRCLRVIAGICTVLRGLPFRREVGSFRSRRVAGGKLKNAEAVTERVASLLYACRLVPAKWSVASK